MKRLLILAIATLLAVEAHATIKPCEELKSEIAAKIDANGVKQYTLEILPADQEDSRQTVGTCDGGTKKIVYQRG